MQLLLNNQKESQNPSNSYRIEANEEEATIYVYDVISSWLGISADQFIQDLNAISAPVIHLRVNSPGGEVFEARAMHTALREHPAKVIAHVDSLAASSASFLIMAADEIEIAEGAFIMIHNAWVLMIGNASELRDEAELLEKIDITIAADYQKRTGLEEDQINEWMSQDTWFSGPEAVEHGFADRLADTGAAENRFDLSAYSNVPKALTEAGKPNPSSEAAARHAENVRRLSVYDRAAA